MTATFPAELKAYILKMVENPNQCRSIVNACNSDKRNRNLCTRNIDSLWTIAGFDRNIQPKNMTTFTHQCNRDIHRVLKCAHDLLLSAQEYNIQQQQEHVKPRENINYYYYKFLPTIPSLKNIQVFPNDVMNNTELVEIAKNVKTAMSDIIKLCESDEWLSTRFVLDSSGNEEEEDDEESNDEEYDKGIKADMDNLNAIRDFVNSTSDFYMYDYARTLSSVFCGVQETIDSANRFLFGDGN